MHSLFSFRRIGLIACALLPLAACGGIPHSAQEPAPDDLAAALSTGKAIVPALSPNQRWNEVAARFAKQRRDADVACGGRAVCPAARWNGLIAELRSLPLRERVIRANAALNQLPYVPAATNWNDPSYWETPYEFLSKGGQCQDYAIAKYLALAETGVPATELRFVVVRDTQNGLDHAITIVTIEGEDLVLDNQAKDVVPAAGLRRYVPYYALGGAGLRVYGPRQSRPAQQQIANFADYPYSPYTDKNFQLAHY